MISECQKAQLANGALEAKVASLEKSSVFLKETIEETEQKNKSLDKERAALKETLDQFHKEKEESLLQIDN